jgi:hypothetical protein
MLNTRVLPVAEFGSAVCVRKEVKAIEQFVMGIVKTMFGMAKAECVALEALRGDLTIWTMYGRHVCNALRLLENVHRLPEGHPLRELYLTLLEESEGRMWPQNTWVTWIREFLLEVGQENLLYRWPRKSEFTYLSPRAIVEAYQCKRWMQAVKELSSLHPHYVMLKPDWGPEDYIRLSAEDAAMLFSFRTEYGDFAVHTGRTLAASSPGTAGVPTLQRWTRRNGGTRHYGVRGI